MIIVPSSRPGRKRVKQKQPHLVESDISSMSVTPFNTTVSTGATGRQTVLETDFGGGDSGIENNPDLDWDFYFATGELTGDGSPSINGTQVTVTDAGTMNGVGASLVEWDPGSAHDVRWGGVISLPLLPGFESTGYPEGWLTFEVMFHSPFPSISGQKHWGVYGAGKEPPATDGYGCDEGFSSRLMLSGNSGGASTLKAHMYSYVSQDARDRDNWDSGNAVIPVDTVSRIELYWKINSAFNVQDGVLIHRFDPGTSTTHATPNTIRYQKNNVYMYCGSESNRSQAGVYYLSGQHFFGGATQEWQVDFAGGLDTPARMTFGLIKVEIPA